MTAPRKPSEILRAAKKLIEKEEHWCQGESSRDSKGFPCRLSGKRAKSRCANGAVWSASHRGRENFMRAWSVIQDATSRVSNGSLPATFNDTHTHPEVLSLFDRAIALAEAEEAGR